MFGEREFASIIYLRLHVGEMVRWFQVAFCEWPKESPLARFGSRSGGTTPQ